MNSLLTTFKGKLTYTLAAVAILWGILGFTSGTMDSDTAMEAIWAGLGLFGLRRAV